jgi:hypothetical protein
MSKSGWLHEDCLIFPNHPHGDTSPYPFLFLFFSSPLSFLPVLSPLTPISPSSSFFSFFFLSFPSRLGNKIYGLCLLILWVNVICVVAGFWVLSFNCNWLINQIYGVDWLGFVG